MTSMSDVVAITGIIAAFIVVLAGLFVLGGVLRRYYDAKIASSKRMSALRQRQYAAEEPPEPEEEQGGLDLAALAAPGGLDAALGALNVPAAIRPAIASFVDGAGGLQGVANILQKKLAKKNSDGGWDF